MSADCDLDFKPMTFQRWSTLLKQVVAPEFESDARREYRRYHISGDLKVTFVRDGQEYKRSWDLLEVSLQGLTARANNEASLGVSLEIRLDVAGHRVRARGKVVHCTGTLGGYKVGIELDFPDEE
ncbi:MAG: PilZ domain-containing protein [Phycisphaerae bacterium]|nr:PilZ domain-containing protein [Phycisphaerae bacterium]